MHSFSFVMVEVLQTGALTCVTSSFPLLHLLLIIINAHYKCVTCLGFIHYLNDKAVISWTHQLPTYSCLCLCDKIGII